MMVNTYFPYDWFFDDYRNLNNHSLVQFYHRNLAYMISIYVLLLSIIIYKKKIFNLYKPLKILIFFIFLQIVLGILTLIS